MSTVIYVDVLLVINLFVNYFLILSARAIAHLKIKRLRALAAALIGSLYSLIIFLPELNIVISISLRVLCSILIVITAFGIRNIKSFFKAFGCFFLVNFAFAGIMLGIWLVFEPGGMVYQNGAVYFDIDAVILTLSTIACYVIICIISHFMKRRVPDSHLVTLTIINNNNSVTCPALFDTGNTLTEPFSAYPVIVCEYSVVQSVMDDVQRNVVSNINCASVSSNHQTNVRFVSFRSVGGEGMLFAFRPQKVKICDRRKYFFTDKIYIAVYNGTLSGGEYNALIGNSFFEKALKGDRSSETDFAENKSFVLSYKR